MTQLVELPSNVGGIIAIDPHAVTAVQPYRATLPTRGTQIFDMCAVWVDHHNIYVCSWSVEQVLEVLNAARRNDAAIFAAGYRAGSADTSLYRDLPEPGDVPGLIEIAWKHYLSGESR